MNKKGMTMAALVTAMMLGVTSIPADICAETYENVKADKYFLKQNDYDRDEDYYGRDDYDCDEDYYDRDDYDNDEDYYGRDDYDCDEDYYDRDDYDSDEDYNDDDDYDSDAEEDDDDWDLEFIFDQDEYTIKIKTGTKSYSDCGMDFSEELYFDDEQYELSDIEWSVDDESIATVDDEGYLTAVAPGSVILTAELDGEEADCEVIVPEPTYKLNKKKAVIKVGKKVKLSVLSNPTSVKKVVKWSSGKKTVATVKNGIVTGKNKGKTKVKAKIAGKTYTCTIKVKK